jgi:hypothetical protein
VRDIIFGENTIGADDRKAVQAGLCDQVPIERIEVMKWQRKDLVGMLREYRQKGEPGAHDARTKIRFELIRQGEFADRRFDRDFPSGTADMKTAFARSVNARLQ